MNVLFLEVLKFTLPALVVFMTTYFLFRQYFDNQFRLKQIEMREMQIKGSLPLKLQSYERLALLFERISLPSMVFRMQLPDMTVRELQAGLLVTVQQEFDHNLAQQIYVSATLWEVLVKAKEQNQQIISLLASEFDPNSPASKFVDKILNWYNDNQKANPSSLALDAIRKEAALYI